MLQAGEWKSFPATPNVTHANERDAHQLTDEELKEHARRIAKDHLQDFEFLSVVEDEDLEDASEEDLRAIHDLITGGTVTID